MPSIDSLGSLRSLGECLRSNPGPGLWAQQAKLVASDATANDIFGYSVAINSDGTTAIIGAPQKDDGLSFDAGAAYIFTRSGTTWTQQAKIQAGDPTGGDLFGRSVAISNDGTTVIVGAPFQDTGVSNAGAAYIFTRSGTTWTQQAKIQASTTGNDDRFGQSVSLSSDGSMAIIGAWLQDTGASNAGAAYIFTRSGTTWTQQAKIQAGDPVAKDDFGYSVAINSDGTTVIVGTPFKDTGATDSGAAYIFTRSGTTWTQQAKIQASDVDVNDHFGISVSITGDGNTVAISKQSYANKIYTGGIYIFTRSGTTWTQQQKLYANDSSIGSASLSYDGNTLTSAGYSGTDTPSGSAYIFNHESNGWIQKAKIRANDLQDGDEFGYPTSMNNDGTIAIIGAQYKNISTADEGSAYIFVKN